MRDTVRKTKVNPTRAQQAMIIDLVRQHCRLNENGCAVYNHPWNDDAIARAVGDEINETHVAKWRVDLIGPLVKSVGMAILENALKVRLDALERLETELALNVDALLQWATRQDSSFTSDWLSHHINTTDEAGK